jgi:hypothetical protein
MAHAREIPAHRLWTDAEAANYVGKPTKTLANWRHLGTGPAFIKVGNRVRYRPSDVDRWLDEHTIRPGAA